MTSILLNFRRATIPVLLFAVFIAASCSRPIKMDINDVPIPPNAVKGNKYPEFGTQMHNAINSATDSIEGRIGDFDSQVLTFNEPTNWQEIARFYDAQLKDKGFVRKSDKPVESGGTPILFYEQSGFSGKNGIAAALIEATDYRTQKKYHFLLLGVSKN